MVERSLYVREVSASQIAGVVLAVAAVSVFVYAFARNRSHPGSVPWEGAAAAVGVFAVLSTVFFNPPAVPLPGGQKDDIKAAEPAPTVTVTVTPPPPKPVEVDIELPADGGRVGVCSTVSGTVAGLGEDQVVIVGNRDDRSGRWFFEYQVLMDASRTGWRSGLTLGEQGEKYRGQYDLIVFAMPKAEAAYLASTAVEQNATYWSAPELPSSRLAGSAQIRVTRTLDESQCV